MISQFIAINFYFGLWRYGELGFVSGLRTYTVASIMITWAALGAKGWLKHIDIGDTALCLLAVTVLLTTFPALKSAIPLLVPYQHDALFISLDKTLHFGRHAFEYFELFHNSVALWVMTSFYYAYFAFLSIVVCATAFCPPGFRSREAFLMAFIAVWYFNGCVLAVIASSVGPIFLDTFYDGKLAAPFTDAIQNICTLSTITCDIRNWLIEMHFHGNFLEFNTPSAMPSLHVSQTFLIALYVQNSFRKYALYTWTFFAITLASSIALLWHYAIDGYVAIITTYIIWRLCLRWVARHNRLHQPAPNTLTA